MSKKVLCRHDVQDINHAYQTLDQLEKQVTVIPSEINSGHALQKLIGKVIELVRRTSSDNLISLYHLRNLIDKEDLLIDQCFSSLQGKFNCLKDIDPKMEMASDLPYCHSVAEFDQDVEVLIGPDRSSEVTGILETKRAELKNNARLNLLHGRAYPNYFRELLENGYIHLFDYLIEMRNLPSHQARADAIKKMNFSEISHVILETRDVILQKVLSSITSDSQNILFLLGRSGAGKSTVYCYLRRDKMVPKDSRYESSNDNCGLIGADEKSSCTFLPGVQKVDDWTLVDFPGFENSNGLLVKLGLEMALKVLVRKYHPKILVVEAITNIEGKFASAAALGKNLERLLGDDKKNCELGITKYSEDPDAVQIKDLERQEKEHLTPSREESERIGEIRALSALQMRELPSIHEQKNKEIEGIQRKRKPQWVPLNSESQKAACLKRIEERENELLNQIGLTKKISFNNLEDPAQISSCFQRLSASPAAKSPLSQLPVREVVEECLNPEDKSFLEYLLVNNLLKEMKSKEGYQIEIENVKVFEQKVLESSLSEAVSSLMNPEIGKFFLCLQEVDPQLVRKYEKKIIHEYINGYMKAIINTFDFVLIKMIISELKKAKPESLANLQKLTFKLRDYIVGVLGIPLPRNEEQSNKRWDELQKKHQQEVDRVSPGFLYNGERSSAMYRASNDTLDVYCKKLNQIYESLLILKDLKKYVKKSNEINNVFESVEIKVTSWSQWRNEIENKISKIRDVYGIEDWDRRVSFLIEKGINIDLESRSVEVVQHIHYIFIYAYSLIEPDTKIVEFEHKARDNSRYLIVAVSKASCLNLPDKAIENHRSNSIGPADEFTDLKIKFKNEIVSLMIKRDRREFDITLNIELTNKSSLMRALLAAAFIKTLENSEWYKNLRKEEIV
ncbi:MAG: hypothetical protein JSS10_01180 [Verrucomicrobia bacterium]|nr:hypothetical protein [Verrucomicrobiota bacterium]